MTRKQIKELVVFAFGCFLAAAVWAGPEFTTRPSNLSAHVHRNAVQTLTNNVVTDLAFNDESSGWDPQGWHDTATNNERITPDVPGLYLVTCSLNYDYDADGYRQFLIYKNGTDLQTAVKVDSLSSGSASTFLSISALVTLDGATDYVSAKAHHTAGNNLDVGGANNYLSSLRVVWVAEYPE